MKERLFLLLLSVFVLNVACEKDEPVDFASSESDDKLTRGQNIVIAPEFTMDRPMILGAKLQNPYSVANMKLASANLQVHPDILFPIKPADITTTHYYVRFKPQTEDELKILKENSTLVLYEYPLDYEIVENGSSYHDPSVPEDMPTYQYASIKAYKWNSIK